ncbi:Acyl-protein thioesterase 2 [Symbiodinium microadriaticum]|uniref:Acyl-protein thioesterase 2 n=1 Tax=Symbiodinium microadriaticum TaxID=2951 RepID=A0A1Q9BUU1_SYMMI|nr:Acyl-protein thioesterase 2 [Symbiodinium microadriaticum]
MDEKRRLDGHFMTRDGQRKAMWQRGLLSKLKKLQQSELAELRRSFARCRTRTCPDEVAPCQWLQVRRGIPPNRIFLVGYSQGGGLALAAALRAPRRLGGVLMLSSWVAEPLPDDFKDCCSRPGVESYMLIQ